MSPRFRLNSRADLIHIYNHIEPACGKTGRLLGNLQIAKSTKTSPSCLTNKLDVFENALGKAAAYMNAVRHVRTFRIGIWAPDLQGGWCAVSVWTTPLITSWLVDRSLRDTVGGHRNGKVEW